jgi:LysR family transcriptional regulator, hydrogen peroxide-inducible genes activator
VQMVGAGIGVTLIPEMALPIETRSAAVSIARLRHPRPARTIGMVWRKSSPLAEQFVDIAGVIRQATATRVDHAGRPPGPAPAESSPIPR